MVTANVDEGSKGYLVEEKQEETAVTTATKQFGSSAALSSWLHDPMTPKLYNVLNVDWTKNKVRVECTPLISLEVRES